MVLLSFSSGGVKDVTFAILGELDWTHSLHLEL